LDCSDAACRWGQHPDPSGRWTRRARRCSSGPTWPARTSSAASASTAALLRSFRFRRRSSRLCVLELRPL